MFELARSSRPLRIIDSERINCCRPELLLVWRRQLLWLHAISWHHPTPFSVIVLIERARAAGATHTLTRRAAVSALTLQREVSGRWWWTLNLLWQHKVHTDARASDCHIPHKCLINQSFYLLSFMFLKSSAVKFWHVVKSRGRGGSRTVDMTLPECRVLTQHKPTCLTYPEPVLHSQWARTQTSPSRVQRQPASLASR